MASLREMLPPANSLVSFEAAARHLNFTHAAKELSVTQAAVSRQIKILEEHLGTHVFERLSCGLRLTSQGARLHQAVTMGYAHIANTVVEIGRTKHSDGLTVSTSVPFANYWLMSRITKFRAAHPDIAVRLVASAPIHDLAMAGIDVAVRYGRGNWTGVNAVHLLDNEVFPICAPSYMSDRPLFKEPAELLSETLLHLIELDRNWVTWDTWLPVLGVRDKPLNRGLEFDSYLILTQALLDGQGIALGGGQLAGDFLAHGALIRPIDATLISEQAFYLLTPKEIPISSQTDLFNKWMLSEAGKLNC